MTVDVEDWHHSISSVPFERWDHYEPRLEIGLDRILDLFDSYDIRATFFVLGYVARKYPGFVGRIQQRGHEIATHGDSHRLVYQLTPDEFRKDLRRSLDSLEEVTQEKVLGFRAPYWSITRESYWALDILVEEGLIYDSSIYPIRTPLYGIPGTPTHPYRISTNQSYRLIEFPPSASSFWGLRVPACGGLYLRLFPGFFVRSCLRRINRTGHPGLVYIHPPEFDPAKPVLAMPLPERILHYWNLRSTEPKVESLLQSFEFTTVRETLLHLGFELPRA